MKKIRLLIFLSIALVFSGCVVNSLEINNKKLLSLTVDEKSQILSTETLSKKYDFYTSLDIYKYVLKNEDKILFYEDVTVNDNYALSYSLLNTIKFVFATKNLHVVAKNKDVTFAQLELDNKVFVNIIISYNYSQNFSYVYGYSNYDFMKIVNATVEEKQTINRPLKQGITLLQESMPLSKWSTQMLIIQPLISRVVKRSVF